MAGGTGKPWSAACESEIGGTFSWVGVKKAAKRKAKSHCEEADSSFSSAKTGTCWFQSGSVALDQLKQFLMY